MARGDDTYNYRVIGGSFNQTNLAKLRADACYGRLSRMDGAVQSAGEFADILPQEYLNRISIELPPPFDDRRYLLAELIDFQEQPWYLRKDHSCSEPALIERFLGNTSRLTELLYICHERASNAEKDAPGQLWEPRRRDRDFLSTVFGYEAQPLEPNSYRDLWNCFGVDLKKREECFRQRRSFLQAAAKAYSPWPADSRWPVNDVSLYDISFAVAAFFKAAVAKCLLDGAWPWTAGMSMQRHDPRLAWRIARLCFDGPSYYGRVARVPDLLIRRKLLDGMLDNVRRTVEEELCVANEVYRDDRGACYLIAVLATQDDDGQFQRAFEAAVQEAAHKPVRIEGHAASPEQLVPGEEIGLRVFFGQSDARGLGIGQAIQQPDPLASADPATLRSWWRTRNDICPVCQLRPIGPEPKALNRKVCGVCENRREGRSKSWLEDEDSTIWLDEVADLSGRFALVCCRFQLERWLSGEEIERSLFVQKYGVTNGAVMPLPGPEAKKNATFARVQRVWRNTAEFWTCAREALKRDDGPVGCGGRRLAIEYEGESFGDGHSLYLHVDRGLRISVVQKRPGEFVTAENLNRAAVLAGCESADPLEFLAEKTRGRQAWVEIPTGFGRANESGGTVGIREAQPLETRYSPMIELLSEPHMAMFLVPANAVMGVAERIYRQYVDQLGKVRNRLPFHVSVVIAKSGAPLAGVLDAARKMNARQSGQEVWGAERVHNESPRTRIEFQAKQGEPIEWEIPSYMGTGRHEDVWYSYYQVDNLPGKPWLPVHKLESGHRVSLSPASFDFEYLQQAGTRFEVVYDEGRRKGRRAKPYYLDRVPELRQAWRLLNAGLERSQIHALGALLREKELFWGSEGTEAWVALARSAILEADWKHGERPNRAAFEQVIAWAKSGLLLDVIELYLHVIKNGE
jgi:hypothetical protein